MQRASMKTELRRLEETLYILQSKQIQTQSNSKYNPAISQKASENNQNCNRFASLGSRTANYENAMEVEDTASTAKIDKIRPAKTETVVPDDRLALEDDDLGEWIELSYSIYVSCVSLDRIDVSGTNRPLKSLDAILDQTKKYWTEGANGILPICLAAWLSSAAFHEVGRRYKKCDYDTLLSEWTRHRMKRIEIRFNDIPGLQSETRRFTDLKGLSFHRSLLQHYRTLQENARVVPEAGRYEDFSKIIAPFSKDNKESAFHDHLAIYQMLKHIRQLLASKRAIAAIETPGAPQAVCEPLLPFIDQVFSDKELPIHVQLVFGMEMLLASYKGYTWPDGVLNRQNCRILVLQFALEVQKSFSETIRCIQRRRESASAFNLSDLQSVLDGLEGYTRENRFDLYSQAPWTAGCHIVEILSVAMFEGLHLCCDTGYLCALLHLYNALRKIDSNFRQIKLLDQLCEIFLDKLFLGVFPTENFSSHFRRAMGGPLNWETNVKRSNQMELSKPIPGISMRKTGSTRLSAFYDLHTFGYEPSAEFWHLAFEAKPRWQPTTRREQDEALKRAYSSPLTVSLEKVKENVVQEFNGPLPVARINYLAVFDFSVNSMEELCKSFSAIEEQKVQPDRDLGFTVVDSLLVQIVDHQRDNKLRLLLPYWKPVNNAKLFFNGLDGKQSLEQFLWKSAI
jgi:hypothetical protein